MENSPHFINKLFSQVYNYSKKRISYKRNFFRYFIIIGSNVLVGIFIYFATDLFKTYPDKTPFYLFFLIIVGFSTFFGGLYSAYLTTGIISLEAYFLFRVFYKTDLDLTLYIQLAFFIIGAFIISHLLDMIKENSEVKKLKKQEEVYAQAFVLLNEKYQTALENITARDQFLSIISHELKTPLAVMLLKLHDILNNVQSVSLANFSIHKLTEVLKNSEQQIKWLSIMINDLLDVSLISTGRMKLQLEDTDLVSLTGQIRQSFSEMLKKEKYIMKIYAKSPVVGRWDKVRIKQAITNLVSNAIKYGESRPIEIKIFKNGNQGKFIIKDTGIGIPTKEQKIVFDLFKRASGSQEYKKGLGVGLFITAQIVKMHGGMIKVFSIPKKGTSFTIELPLNKIKTSL